ncbi:MAG: CPBP family intramembrane metalloprotease [Bacteroidia bacterium]|nr:CPBP family intramembrane metalloprotease [Bacteroidia bacterium]MBT8275563.1 CPBP family intramembrane metalloprotease [Bacteroidia bacterium]NNF31488.1 CPBP family intramembrane metalloprotease [Flavobacteriaceae bacterium]NNJ82037.1 CPBP family intramembrane metalloprotease [Flavobacteriaceae bacterium]NNK54067.1 CPBP family intramembrane metalloprotease [Flavobacteriaceae bacterium]
MITEIKESIITKWIVLYYTFFFILGSYLLLQLLFTTLQFLLFNDPEQTVTIQGFYVVIGEAQYQIWDIAQFHIAIVLSSCIALGLIIITVKLLVKTNPLHYLGFRSISNEHHIWFLYSFLVLVAGVVLHEFVISTSDVLITAEKPIEKFLVVLGLGVFGPIFEECLYRGFLLKRMDDILKQRQRWITITATAFLFSVFHFQYNPVELLYVFSIGMFLALMRFKTGSLWFPIVFHIVGNLYAILTIIL